MIIVSFVICSLFVAGMIGYKDYSELNQICFVVDMKASRQGISQVFFDAGHGYNQQDSSAIQIHGGSLQTIVFPLPAKAIKSIRFDPTNTSSVVKIKDARIENKHGDIMKKFPLKDFRAIQQINKMDISDGTLIIHTVENANDPIIQIENSSIDIKVGWKGYITKRGWIMIVYFLLSLLFLICLNYFVIIARRSQYIVSRVRRLKMYVAANPKKSIAFIGLTAAIASCYPVVFFGMSFVSPAGVVPLYPYQPWMPGFPLDVIVENFRSSDVGANA